LVLAQQYSRSQRREPVHPARMYLSKALCDQPGNQTTAMLARPMRANDQLALRGKPQRFLRPAVRQRNAMWNPPRKEPRDAQQMLRSRSHPARPARRRPNGRRRRHGDSGLTHPRGQRAHGNHASDPIAPSIRAFGSAFAATGAKTNCPNDPRRWMMPPFTAFTVVRCAMRADQHRKNWPGPGNDRRETPSETMRPKPM